MFLCKRMTLKWNMIFLKIEMPLQKQMMHAWQTVVLRFSLTLTNKSIKLLFLWTRLIMHLCYMYSVQFHRYLMGFITQNLIYLLHWWQMNRKNISTNLTMTSSLSRSTRRTGLTKRTSPKLMILSSSKCLKGCPP